MDETVESWEKSAPADLVVCHWLVYDQAVKGPAKEFTNNIIYSKKTVGASAANRFADLTKECTPSSIFKAFHLYLEVMSIQAVLVFTELAAIGRNEGRLRASYVEMGGDPDQASDS